MTTTTDRDLTMTTTPLRRNRNYRLLWIGGAISALGSRASSFAYPLLILALGGTGAEASLVAAAATLPYLVVPILAGPVIDRVDRRRAMLLADASRLLLMGGVVALALAGNAHAWTYAALAFAEGSFAMVHSLAEPAALRRVVPQEQLTEALAGTEARGRAGFLLGQPVGGALFGIGRALPFVFDAATYLVSLTTSLLLRGNFRIEPDSEEDPRAAWRKAVDEIRKGISWLWANRFLRVAVLAIAASNALFQALTLIIIVRARAHGVAPAAIGLLFLGAGIGGVLGSLAAGWVSRHVRLGTAVIAINWLWALLTPIVMLTGHTVLVAVTFAFMSFCGPIWNVMVAAHQLKITPERLLARVGGAIGTIAFGALPLGSLLGGYLSSLSDSSTAAWILGVLMALVAVAVHASPAVRNAADGPASPEGNA